MNIKVWDNKYVITSDKLCYTLKEIKTKQSKDDEDNSLEVQANNDGTYETAIAYHDTVAGCFRTIVEREGRQNKCTTLDGYIKHLKSVSDKLEENLKKFEKIVDADTLFNSALSKATKDKNAS